MFELDILEKLLEGIGQYNRTFFPFSIILPALLALTALILSYFCFVHPGIKSSSLRKDF